VYDCIPQRDGWRCNACPFVSGLWDVLDESVRIKCRRLVESFSPETTSDGTFLAALLIEPLREDLTYRPYELEDSDLSGGSSRISSEKSAMAARKRSGHIVGHRTEVLWLIRK
jgi:hypothetical protein